MNKKKKKAFTIVELVIVIAVIAILAAVLIPTFASIIKKANDSAYLQERTNQTIIDSAEEIENPDYLSWKDFEALLAKKIVAARSAEYESLKTAVASAVTERRVKESALTDKQLAAIIERTLKGELTTAMVDPIVEAVVPFEAGAASLSLAENAGIVTLSENDRKDIVDKVIAKLDKEIGITADEMAAAIKAVKNDADPTAALTGFKNDLTDKQIQEIIAFALGQPAGDVGGNTGGNEGGNVTPEAPGDDESTIAVDAITLNAYRGNVEVYGRKKLFATISPESATEKIEWTSSNEEVATVDDDGIITAVKEGKVTITVKSASGKVTATYTLRVNVHKHEYSPIGAKQDETYHTGLCTICNSTQTEKHYYSNNICVACGDKRATTPTDCKHEHVVYVDDTGITDTHYKDCLDCLTRIEEYHAGGTTCNYCGHHNCLKTYTYNNTETHTHTCSCGLNEELPHLITNENNRWEITPEGHKINCYNKCDGAVFEPHTETTICTVCGFDTSCKHNGTFTVLSHDATNHRVKCDTCGTVIEESHVLDTNTEKCKTCGVYVSSSKFSNLVSLTSDTVIYLTNNQSRTKTLKIEGNANVTIYLCGNTLKLSNACGFSVGQGCTLVLQGDGQITGNQTIATANKSSKLTINNVTIGDEETPITSANIIVGNTSSNITLQNSTIYSTNSNVNVINYSNSVLGVSDITVNISDCTFTFTKDTTPILVNFAVEVGGTNTIKINETDVVDKNNKTTSIDSKNVTTYLSCGNAIVNITPPPAVEN